MSEENVDKLLTGMNEIFGGIFEHHFGDNAIARHEMQKEEREEIKRIVASQQTYLDYQLNAWKKQQENRENRALDAVDSYCNSRMQSAMTRFSKSPNVPILINWKQRNAAFRKINDSDRLLMRIEQTINAADKAIRHNVKIDFNQAVSEMTRNLTSDFQKLEAVTVASCKDSAVADDLQNAIERTSLDRSMNAERQFVSVENAIIKAFRSNLSKYVEETIEKTGPQSDLARREKELQNAIVEAGAAARAAEAQNARQVQGSRIDCDCVAPFDKEIPIRKRYDEEDLLRLLAEVRKSFSTYKQVVEVNGVFAAFPDLESNFGECSKLKSMGYESSGTKRKSVKSEVKSNKGRPNTLPNVIENMIEFNNERYWGMLDDDFLKHVNYFWYGFDKLMHFANRMYSYDINPLYAHYTKISLRLGTQARILGAYMNDEQLEDFRRQIDEL